MGDNPAKAEPAYTREESSGASVAGHLDSTGFSMAKHIDRLFPSASSLDNVDVAAANTGHRLHAVKQEIRRQLRAQSDSHQQQTQSIEATKAAIGELYTRISEMKAKAQTSERMVFDITQDIKALDFAKRNLSQATATMRRLQLLVSGVGQLRQFKEQKRYGEAARLLPAIAGLREGFSEHMGVRAIARLDDEAAALQRSLGSMAFQEVQRGFDAQGLLVGDAELMHQACLCCAGTEEQTRVKDLYCELQLRAYVAIFQIGDDVSQLENVSRRYAWLRRILRNYAEEHAPAFPDAWRMGEELSRRFAHSTRDHLGETMATRDIDVGHLTAALADTLAFEAQCDKKFGIVRRNGAAVYESSGAPAESFVGSVSCAFEPYMAVFISGEQAKFEALVRRFRSEPGDDDPSLNVLASSTDLLYQFRESLRQCAALSTGQAMADLAQVFAQSLSNYARSVLVHVLPRISSTTAAPLDALRRACLVANTADYCASAAAQLEQKIIEKVDGTLREQVTFAASRDALLGAINSSIGALVGGVDAMCAPALAALTDAPWHDVQTVGDQSEYVLLIASAIEAATSVARVSLSGPRYFRSYCDKLASRTSERYMTAIVQCKRISEIGAEQLLLDAQALKSVLLRVPSIGADDDAQPPPTYARIVAQGVGRIEALLKAILVPTDPADALVGRFLLLFPAAPRDVFRHVLSLKGVKPADHPAYLRVLQAHQRQTQLDKQDQQDQQSQITGDVPVAAAPSAYATPDPRSSSMPAHVMGRVPASAPLVSRTSTARAKEHSRFGSTAEHSAHMSPETHHAGQSQTTFQSTPYANMPDPLGITSGPSASNEQTSDIDAQSPVLASLAANATATRTKINENLRKFMSTMRRP
ncbi:Vacuolar protein sorting-associated protein 53 [Coemansia sp. RSA 1972]|nr:Vacuolar protein sorting-associated protein 53 [Coemansia sp. RSA 1972]